MIQKIEHRKTVKKITAEKPKIRAAAYCRVSTAQELQEDSFELQMETYRKKIESNPDLTLVDVYGDLGRSGTQIKGRNEFQRMMKDCRDGKIDLIYCKSMAEQESRTKSDIMNRSFENRIKNGIFLTPPLYGYDQDENGDLVVNEQEAKVVQFIYYSFLTGFNCSEIANFLTSLHIKTYSGKDTWNSGTIRGIIRNERHCGDILAHKTYTPDFLTHKHKVNHGERTWVRKEDHHDPIVSRIVWTAANRKMEVEFRNRKGETLPSLSVVDQGILKGYVPVDRNIRGFSEADYEEASRSVLTDDLDEQIEKKHGTNYGNEQVVEFRLEEATIIRDEEFRDPEIREP